MQAAGLKSDLHIFCFQDHINKSRRLLRKFFKQGKNLFNDEWASYKNHSIIHMPDDAENMEEHLDALAAYVFENMQRLFTNVSTIFTLKNELMFINRLYLHRPTPTLCLLQLLRSGKNPVSQIARGLAVYRKYKSHYVQYGKNENEAVESLEDESERILRYGRKSLALPGMSLKKVVHVQRSKTTRAFFHSTMVSNKYSNIQMA